MPAMIPDNELAEMRRMLVWFRQQRPQRRADPLQADHEEHPAPEVYVARSPQSGVPAMQLDLGTLTGTGSALQAEDDISRPGVADCDIFRVLPTGAMEKVDGLSKEVHNLSEKAIPKFQFFPIKRDKFGTWIVDWTHPDALNCLCSDDETTIGHVTEVAVVGRFLAVTNAVSAVIADEDCCPRIMTLQKSTNYYSLCVDCPDGTGTGTGTGPSPECCVYAGPICVDIARLTGCTWPVKLQMSYKGFSYDSGAQIWHYIWASPPIDPFAGGAQAFAGYEVVLSGVDGFCKGYFSMTRSDDEGCSTRRYNISNPCQFPKSFTTEAEGVSQSTTADIVLTAGTCAEGTGTGTGSGTGGCTPSRSSSGSNSSFGLPSVTLVIGSVTAAAGAKIVVMVAQLSGNGQVPSAVSWGGNGLSMHQAIYDGNGNTLSTWDVTAPSAGTHDVTVTMGTGSILMANCVEVECSTSLANEGAGSQAAAAPSTDSLFSPDAGYAQAAFLLTDPGGSHTWASGFSSGGQDVSTTFGGHTYVLTEGYKVLSASGNTQATLTGVTPATTDWNLHIYN